ncbi:hypothetical protein BH18THE1_BH18THE1_12230 [soil metagenome]
MPMLMLKCKNCGEVFPGVYLPEDTIKDSKTNSTTSHVCSRGHKNDYLSDDFMDWSGPETF